MKNKHSLQVILFSISIIVGTILIFNLLKIAIGSGINQLGLIHINKMSSGESLENFDTYVEKIDNVLQDHGYSNKVYVFSPTYIDCIEQNCRITFSDDKIIYITFINNGITNFDSPSDKGIEQFNVKLVMNHDYIPIQYSSDDLSLFCDIVNCISRWNLSEDYCNEFLNAPEEKYLSDRYMGYEKKNDDFISKRKAINFFENWLISYDLKRNLTETLEFEGLTLATE